MNTTPSSRRNSLRRARAFWALAVLAAAFPFNMRGQSPAGANTAPDKPSSVHAAATGSPVKSAAAALAPTTIPDLALELVPIPAGSFTMGSPASEAGRREDEYPQTKVTLTQHFWLGKTEVTQGQWQAITGSGVEALRAKAGSENPFPAGPGPEYPIYYVTYEEAMAFCRALTDREKAAGRLPEGYAYTLPTEAQWEYACRAGTSGPFAAASLDTVGWYTVNTEEGLPPVATKAANSWGLHDMHGSMMELCLGWHWSKPSNAAVSDPSGPASGSRRVARGGCWDYNATECRSASLRGLGQGIRSHCLGFRVALSAVQ